MDALWRRSGYLEHGWERLRLLTSTWWLRKQVRLSEPDLCEECLTVSFVLDTLSGQACSCAPLSRSKYSAPACLLAHTCSTTNMTLSTTFSSHLPSFPVRFSQGWAVSFTVHTLCPLFGHAFPHLVVVFIHDVLVLPLLQVHRHQHRNTL